MSKIWTNWLQLSDWVENIVGKGEIALYEQFLLFPQCFQKLSVIEYLWSKGLKTQGILFEEELGACTRIS